MKTIKILVAEKGGMISDEVWNQLIKIDNGELHETENSYIINLTNGKKLTVDKTKVHKSDGSRIMYWGSMKEIGGPEFHFSKMKGIEFMHELMHFYYPPALGGFIISFTAD